MSWLIVDTAFIRMLQKYTQFSFYRKYVSFYNNLVEYMLTYSKSNAIMNLLFLKTNVRKSKGGDNFHCKIFTERVLVLIVYRDWNQIQKWIF